jgi:predicted permease
VLHDIYFRVKALLSARRADAELAEELQVHLDCERQKLERAEFDAVEARRRAIVAFGGVSVAVEECRDARGLRFLTDAWGDARYGARSLTKDPLFSLAVSFSLLLGIGANLTVFTLMRAALFRPLNVAHPEEIVHVRRSDRARDGGRDKSSSYLLYRELRETAAPAARVVATSTPRRRRFGTESDSKERIVAQAVTEDFFAVLGVAPAAGRVFVPGDDGPSGGQRVAVLSHRFWTARFGADPRVVNRIIHVDETPFEVVGVAPPGFDGVDAEQRVEIWVPVTADTAINPEWLRSHDYYWLTLFARLPPGLDASALESALDTRFRAHLTQVVLPEMPPRLRGMFQDEHIQLRPAAAGLATTGRRYESQLRVLAGIAACVFLICCVNVANLVRARNARRGYEFAIRRALGASRPRLFRQLLVEGAMLAGIGAASGLVGAPTVAAGMMELLPAAQPLAFDLSPDRAVVGLATTLAVASALFAMTWPAWRVAADAEGMAAGSRVKSRPAASRTGTAMQLALVLVLLVVSGLCVSVMQRLARVNLGFDADSVASVSLSFPKGAAASAVSGALEAVRRTLQQSAAIESASYAFPAVYDTGGASMGIAPAGYVPGPGEDIEAGTVIVGPQFFETLRIPVREGRAFAATDLLASSDVVVNETFARRYFAGRTAVGESVRIPARPEPKLAVIVGVVGDVRHYGVRKDPWPMVYQPGSEAGSDLLVRGRPGGAALAAIREAVERAGAPAQIEGTRPLGDAVRAMVSRERVLAVLSSGVALVAMALAALGLYGMVAYAVACRRPEFGVRLALGARRVDVQRLVLGETLGTVGLGAAVGIGAGIVAARLLGRLVPDSPALEGPLLVSATLALTAVMLLAASIPAWRASRTDPAETLRSE